MSESAEALSREPEEDLGDPKGHEEERAAPAARLSSPS